MHTTSWNPHKVKHLILDEKIFSLWNEANQILTLYNWSVAAKVFIGPTRNSIWGFHWSSSKSWIILYFVCYYWFWRCIRFRIDGSQFFSLLGFGLELISKGIFVLGRRIKGLVRWYKGIRVGIMRGITSGYLVRAIGIAVLCGIVRCSNKTWCMGVAIWPLKKERICTISFLFLPGFGKESWKKGGKKSGKSKNKEAK